MQACISARETGDVSPDVFKRTVSTQLLRSFAPAPHHRFNGEPPAPSPSGHALPGADRPSSIAAHKNGVGALTLDKFDGRLLLSGGSDGSIRIWDLESHIGSPHTPFTFTPSITIPRSSVGPAPASPRRPGHTHGITHLEFYPFDADAFLSSSFDNTLQLWSTERATPASTFSLGAVVYAHAVSPIAPHLLVACATQHSAVRLVDLKSGAAVQALTGGAGPVLATAWSPRREHVLVSGHADGTARVWDVRRAGAMVGLLDKEDSLGVVHRLEHAVATGASTVARSRTSARAHADAVNALAWTDDGMYIVSGGLDRKIRVWDATVGANTLTSYGSAIQNHTARHQTMIVSPAVSTLACREMLFWPNDREILALDLHEGKLLSRLRTPATPTKPTVAPTTPAAAAAGANHRIIAIAWRGAGGHGRQSTTRMGGSNTLGGLYAAHADGRIRVWMPTVPGPDGDGEDEVDHRDAEDAEKTKKRKALDDAYKSLMGTQMTFR